MCSGSQNRPQFLFKSTPSRLDRLRVHSFITRMGKIYCVVYKGQAYLMRNKSFARDLPTPVISNLTTKNILLKHEGHVENAEQSEDVEGASLFYYTYKKI